MLDTVTKPVDSIGRTITQLQEAPHSHSGELVDHQITKYIGLSLIGGFAVMLILD